jgi:thiamine pyrophosphokinase
VDPAESTVIVFTGGDPVDDSIAAELPDGFVIAADSGLEHAQALHRRVDLAVGDFDSAAPAALRRAEAEGAVLVRHPTAKDQTDFELALDEARARTPDRILVVGGHGGRLDHLLGNALVLASPAYSGTEIDAFMGAARLHVIHARRALHGEVGELLTLLATHGPATGVVTTGLRYPLAGESLEPGSSRGLSNEFVEPTATVSVESGTLLAVRPGPTGLPSTPHPTPPSEEPRP